MQDDEFKFERDTRQCERQIRDYFSFLPDYLDLPGEDEAIYQVMSKKLEKEHLLPSFNPGVNFGAGELGFVFDDDDDDDEIWAELDLLKSPNGRVLALLDDFAVECALAFSMNQTAELNRNYLELICQLAKFSGRVSELLSAEAEEKSLKICLAKRTLADLNLTMVLLRKIPESAKISSEKLSVVRDLLVTLLIENRKI